MNCDINAFKYFKINYSRKWVKGKQNHRNQNDKEKKMAKTSAMFYQGIRGRRIRVQILFSSYNPC